MKKYIGPKEKVLGLKCFTMEKDKSTYVEAYIVGYEDDKYLVRVVETGCVRKLKDVYFKEEIV